MKYPCLSYERGITTLTLLILLSGMLSVIMLFNDDILRLNSALVSQRAIYVEQNSQLQQISQSQKDTACSGNSLQAAENSSFVVFEAESSSDNLSHFIWCRRLTLLKQSPRRGINERSFSEFINETNLPLFQSGFAMPPSILPKDRRNYLYWFNSTQTEWELKGDIYAVVIAEGDLNISGKGRISGAVITGGRLTQGTDVQLAYRRSTVAAIAQDYSRWVRAEKGWNDFKVH